MDSKEFIRLLEAGPVKFSYQGQTFFGTRNFQMILLLKPDYNPARLSQTLTTKNNRLYVWNIRENEWLHLNPDDKSLAVDEDYGSKEDLSKQEINLAVGFVDLGLPSGKKWASRNEKGPYTFVEATKKFGKNLPSEEDFRELIDHCKSEWDDVRKGRVFTGPNGQSIFIPALGYISGSSVRGSGFSGNYWSSSISGEQFAVYLYFDNDVVDNGYNYRSEGYSVRLVQESE